MDQRPSGRLLSQLIHVFSISLSIAIGVVGIINFIQPQPNLNKPSLLVLIVGELISVLPIPLLFLIPKSSIIWSLISINSISSLVSLGAGLSLINFLITSNQTLQSPKLIIVLFSLIIASQFFHGLSLSSNFNSYLQLQNDDLIQQEQYDIENLKNKVVSLKASAATLVDNRKVSGNQESTTTTTTQQASNNDQQSLFQSTKSRFSSKKDYSSSSHSEIGSIIPRNSSSNNNNLNHAHNAQLYSIKKLSVINQSSSTADISIPPQQSQPSDRLSSTASTSSSHQLDDSLKSAQTAKNISMERDALKRIPSALLPPHLKPQTTMNPPRNFPQHQQRSFSQPGLNNFLKTSQSQSNIGYHMEKETIPESIPRAATFENFWPLITQHDDLSKEDNGIKTITPTDYANGFNKFQFNQLRAPMEPSKPLMKAAHFGSLDLSNDQDERFTISDDQMDEQEIPDDVESNVSSKSTEEALKIVENAHQRHSSEFDLTDVAMDQSRSSLNLERLQTPNNLTKSKSHSPHKSIFRGNGQNHGGHYRKISSVSFKNFSVSMPSSPKKKSIMNSPSKKMNIKKNLSLSNIVFKMDNDDDEIPNLSYVHDLQSSPSKRRRPSMTPSFATTGDMNTSHKNHHNHHQHQHHQSTPSKNILEDLNATNSPDSNWSENSHKTVFPSDVIGEYDKEKWKTMQRLHLVKDPESTI